MSRLRFRFDLLARFIHTQPLKLNSVYFSKHCIRVGFFPFWIDLFILPNLVAEHINIPWIGGLLTLSSYCFGILWLQCCICYKAKPCPPWHIEAFVHALPPKVILWAWQNLSIHGTDKRYSIKSFSCSPYLITLQSSFLAAWHLIPLWTFL